MDKKSVLFENRNFVSRVVFNTPENGNVVNSDNLVLMRGYIEASIKSDDCRVIVIEGSNGVFSKGMDFSNLLKNGSEGVNVSFTDPYKDLIKTIRYSPKPVIAKVDGEVVAGGMGIALACDIIIATKRSTFCLSEVLFGIIPAFVFPFLSERLSYKKARYLVLSSRKIQSDEAYNMGLIDEVAATENIDRVVKDQIKRLKYSSPDALRVLKDYSDTITKSDIDNMIDTAQKQLTVLLNDKKNIKAINSFLDGQKPEWAVK